MSDHGVWTCAISDDRSLETVKAQRNLQITVEGKLTLSPSHSILELGEGDIADLHCRMEDGFPLGEISWGTDRRLWGVLNTGTHVEREQLQGSHLGSVSQRVEYRANLRDSGVNISCSVNQGGNLIQSRQIQLKVLPSTALKSQINKSFSMLAVIGISILIIILLIILATIIILKKKRNHKTEILNHSDRSYSTSTGTGNAEFYEPLQVSIKDLYHTKEREWKQNDPSNASFSESSTFSSSSSTYPSSESNTAKESVESDSGCSSIQSSYETSQSIRPQNRATLFHCRHTCFHHVADLGPQHRLMNDGNLAYGYSKSATAY